MVNKNSNSISPKALVYIHERKHIITRHVFLSPCIRLQCFSALRFRFRHVHKSIRKSKEAKEEIIKSKPNSIYPQGSQPIKLSTQWMIVSFFDIDTATSNQPITLQIARFDCNFFALFFIVCLHFNKQK